MPNWTAYVRERLQLRGVTPHGEQDVVDEIAEQLEDAYREAIGRGLSDADAIAHASAHITDWTALGRQVAQSRRLKVSPVDRLEQQVSDIAVARRRGGWFAGVVRDLVFALRLGRRAPSFTAVAIVTLALGIGANTTIFSWINAILLSPLPGADARRIVDVGLQSDTSAYTSMSYPDFTDLRDASTLDGLVVHTLQPAALSGGTRAERIYTEIVSDNFFDVLGVRLQAGRGFLPVEGRAATPVVVISDRVSRSRFGGPEQAIDHAIDINGTPFTVVGVAPPEFSSGYTGLVMDVWVPVPMADKVMPGGSRVAMRFNHWLDAMARLKPGVTASQAAADLTERMRRITEAAGAKPDGVMSVVPLWRSTRGAQSVLGPVLLVLMAMVAIVLLIACANLANWLLSRASARRREFAVRLSLGCSRGRLARQLLTESLLLVSAAAVAAIVLQLWTGRLLTWFVPPSELPIGLASHLDLRVALFTATAALASVVIFGLAPALQAGRTDVVTSLKNESGQTGGRRSWLRSTLVVSQIAFSMLLLVSAGLFLRSLQNAQVVDFGFKTDHVLLSSIDLFSAGYDRNRGMPALTRLLDGIRVLPGVQSVSLARRVPLGIATNSSSTDVEPEGYVAPAGAPAFAYLNWVGPDYFRTMSIPVIDGREFTAADRPDQPERFIINHTFAARYWPGQNAIGKRIRFGKDWFAVAGVVADSRYRRLNEPAAPFIYLSTIWNFRPDVTIHVRTSGDPLLLADSVRSVVRGIDPRLPVFGVMPLDTYVLAASFQQRLAATLLFAFGALALLLASLGLYATMAYAVSRRTRELGARLAMGATPGDITRLVLRQATRLTLVGVTIGLVLAAGAAQLYRSLLVGVQPIDVPTFAVVAVLLSAIAMIASYIPAQRASRLDPLQALRQE